MIPPLNQIDINKKIENDLTYIKNDILCKHLKEDKYIKFSKKINAITIMELTKEQYQRYWDNQYIHFPNEKNIIFQAIEDKFNNGLTSTEEMLNIIENSKDIPNEKSKAIKLLKGEKNKEEWKESN